MAAGGVEQADVVLEKRLATLRFILPRCVVERPMARRMEQEITSGAMSRSFRGCSRICVEFAVFGDCNTGSRT